MGALVAGDAQQHDIVAAVALQVHGKGAPVAAWHDLVPADDVTASVATPTQAT